MTVRIGATRMQTFYTVVFDELHKKSGRLVRKTSSFVEDLAEFRARVEKRGGKIISESGPRQSETIPVSF